MSVKRAVDDLSDALEQQQLEVLPQLRQENSSQYQPVMNIEQCCDYFSKAQPAEAAADGGRDASRGATPGHPHQHELIRANELADSYISEAIFRLANASQANTTISR